MVYTVVKSINNNVVLVKEPSTDESFILMSKGIGFQKRSGDTISDINQENQVFKLWNSDKNIKNYTYQKQDLENVVSQIADMAHSRIGISKTEVYNNLIDHIIFSIDRLNFGLTIENPFQAETYVLYAVEYELAKECVDLLIKSLNIPFSEAEVGYFAVHFNALRRHRPISTSLEHIRVYNTVSNIIAKNFGDSSECDFDLKAFLMSLAGLLKLYNEGALLRFPNQDKSSIQNVVDEIVVLLKNEFNIMLDENSLKFLTVDLEKLNQIYKANK